MERGWPPNFERKIAVRSNRRKAALLKQNSKEEKEILPFVSQYKPLVSIIKEALMKNCNHIQNQPLRCQILKEPLNRRTYTQNHSPTMVQEGGYMEPLPRVFICCSISKRFCLHWKAFDLLNKMRYILLTVALLEARDVINNGRHLGFYQK